SVTRFVIMRFATSIILFGFRISTVLCVFSPLTIKQLEEGMLTLSEDGQPVAECIVKDADNLQRKEFCPITPGFGPRSVGCMSLWKGPVLLKQGCYSGQDLSLEDQCRKEACIASDDTKLVSFCCCFGPLCNERYAEA
ncbi:hypothetical protein PMAYCL1PPCAC_03629, partial [Pristionchus mayeri]